MSFSTSNVGKDPSLLEGLIDQLKQLPGIGNKTATRLAYFVLRQPEEYARDLATALMEAREKLHFCSECCNFSETPLCNLCASSERTDSIVCVVEQPSDVIAFERSRQFNGKYHVLHGAISPLDGPEESNLKIQQLQNRVRSGKVKEVVLATNPTAEGDTTALYVARLIKYNDVKVSRIAHGIPVGAEIEYLDGATLGKALQNRVAL